MRSLRHLAAHAAVVLTAASAFAIPALGRGSDITASVAPPIRFRPAQAPHGFTIVRTAGGVGCRDATLDEAVSASKRSSAEPLHFIKTERADKVASGLTIVLRATNQLEGFPAAKNAFIRAADEWESRIASVITVIVDVDFGPKDFGTPFDTDVIGSTDPQSLTGDGLVGNVRSALISHASSAAETSLYTLIPSSSIPSDIGSVTTTGGSSANLRALGLIGAVANPTTETNFGDPPSIGFNNEFNYDFDPTNGIDAGTTDFNAVVLHELGHVLGFDSDCGLREIQPSAPKSATVLDYFRFRPGITTAGFGSTNRILSSGGTQVFFAGGAQLMLSTGRPDGTGGDGQQSSHWKDDEVTGTFIGLMDPTIADGQHEDLTANDLLAFDTIGYRFTAAPTVTVSNLLANLVGNTLTITGSAQSSSPISLAEVTLLDNAGSGTPLVDLPATPLSLGTSGNFTLQFLNLDDVPAATAARVIIHDNAGAVSAAMVADFSGFETGGPAISPPVKIKGLKLKLTGDGFVSSMQLELNGQASALPAGSKVKPTGKKATINLAGVTLLSGPNRIRFLVNGHHSNIIVLTNN